MENINVLLENSNKYTMKHSLDLRLSNIREKMQIAIQKSRNSKSSAIETDQAKLTVFIQRVFLYLQPQSITYPVEGIPYGRVEIDVEHHYNTITTLSDYFMPRNIIYVDQFQQIKPTFSITIDQDGLEDITVLSDSPIMLTLYVHVCRKSTTSNEDETQEQIEEQEEESVERIPVAQGYIDILEYFNKKRVRSYETIYLYPLKTFLLTCKTEWEIYSLHPLLKNVTFSNVLFITMGSLYNISEDFMDINNNLAANLSLISNVENEINKVFICKFANFQKDIICNQNLSVNWETLKSVNEYENNCNMGIASEAKLSLSDLFKHVLCTENVDFNFDQININEDTALICNSLHRYILTEEMHKTLEKVLATNQYQIILEIYSESDENKILLQGFMDLSIFMYPKVNFCSYAIELKPPDAKTPKSSTKDAVKNVKPKGKGKDASDVLSIKEEKIPFAIVNLCLNNPITNPPEDISEIADIKAKRKKFQICKMQFGNKAPKFSLEEQCELNYKAFDDLIREILDYIIKNEIQAINDDKEFFCNELSNVTNKIMRLIACDFNIRIPTKTNIEFTNLLTTVYRDLLHRVYTNINKCNAQSMENCILTTDTMQNVIITNASMAKCMFEVGNSEMGNYCMDTLRTDYLDNTMLNFYLFLYDVEKEKFDLAQKYLDLPLADKDLDAEAFTKIIKIYVKYKQQLQDPIESETADELLINELTNYSLRQKDDSLTGWILLYCLYKKYNYQPGMTYCRWKYENLYGTNSIVELEFRPTTCWELYLPYKLSLKSLKGQHFNRVFEQLVTLGLYEFAEWVFDEISNDCLEVERYFVLNTFKIFKQSDKKKISTKTFAVDKLENAKRLRATLLQVNGNLEYYRDPLSPNSYKYYREIMDLEDFEDFSFYELALLRYGYRKMDEEQYEEAATAFTFSCHGKINCLAGAIGKGKACYFLGRLKEAEMCFAESTRHGIYMPNVWSYLALTNLRLGNNYNALECWKYARLNPDTEINNEILNELNKINYRDIDLYVDIPDKK